MEHNNPWVERAASDSSRVRRRQISLLVLWGILIVGSSAARTQGTAGPGPQRAGAPPVATPPGQTPPPLSEANQLYRSGKLDEAASAYKAILRAQPKSALAYAGLARVYLKQGEIAGSYAAAARAVELAPASGAARVAMGEVYFRQGKLTEAEVEFVALANANAKEPRAYLGLSRIYAATSNYRRSKGAIDRAYAMDPGDPDIRWAWARTLPPDQQIREVQVYLSSETDNNPEQRKELEEDLRFLQSRAAHHCRPANNLSGMETPLDRLLYDPHRLRAYGLEVKVNGVSSRLELDTGSRGIVISRKVAQRAGLNPVGQTELSGVGDRGDPKAYFSYADSIKIGELELRDCYVTVVDKGAVPEDDGWIGTTVFSDYLVDVDFPREKLRLSELPARPDDAVDNVGRASRLSWADSHFHDRYIAPQMSNYTPVFRFGHLLLIRTRVDQSAPKLFLIDTGAFGNTISPAAAREVTKVSADSDHGVRGVNGAVKHVFRAHDVTLNFARLIQPKQDVVSFDTTGISNSVGTEVSGTLGFSMLRLLRIKIDYRDGLVDFVYDQSGKH